ncbi:MAG TPA: nitrilase-related carbon-nitrogen hydrolase [Candidatus Binataceae bacterium]|jgi:predicted amidohydrolase
MSVEKFTLALAQIGPRLGDLSCNREIITKRVADARAKGADLVLFPELSLTGYFLKDQVPSVALRADSRELKWLRDLSRRIAIVVGAVEESPEFLFHNSGLFFDGGELRHIHRKCYLPTYGLFDEQRYFARGRQIRAFDSRFGRSAILICEDMWHPSTVYVAAADGALNLFCISSSPIWGLGAAELPENAQYWEQLTRFHAMTWGINLAYCNRVGFEDGVGFWGGSQLFDPFGDSVCKAPYFEEALVVGEVSLNKVKRKRMSSTMLRDEDLDLTINELARVRSRGTAFERAAPATVKPPLNRPKRAAKARS